MGQVLYEITVSQYYGYIHTVGLISFCILLSLMQIVAIRNPIPIIQN